MTQVLLVCARPTPWDAEDRFSGATSLPLTPEGRAAIINQMQSISLDVKAIYACLANEATRETAGILGKKFSLRPRNRTQLDELHIGVWRGMRRDELEHRFPTDFALWIEQPQSVEPPEGESLGGAIDRIRPALGKLLHRNRDSAIALALRPLAFQIVLGLLRGEEPLAIASHLHAAAALETIEVEAR